MKTDKEKVCTEFLLNTAWAGMMENLPYIRRIADCEEGDIKDPNLNDRCLIIRVFSLMTAILLRKQAESEKLEDQFESRN